MAFSGLWLLWLRWSAWVCLGEAGERGRRHLHAPVAGTEAAETKPDEVERPLPDIPELMRAVEANQRTSEAVEKDYLYRSVQTQEETDGHGGSEEDRDQGV